MSKILRFLAVLALLVSPLWANTASAATESGGPVVLMGIDAEDGGLGAHGPTSVYQAIVRDIRSKVRNGGSGILVIGGGKSGSDQVTTWWNNIAAGAGLSVTYVNGSAISSRSFAGFAIIGVASDDSNTSWGLTQTENNYFAGRQADVAAFVNNGGGLFGLTSDFSNPYAYLSGVGAFSFKTALSYQDITPTAAGSAIGISNSLDVCCWHDEYSRFPNFLSVLAINPGSGGAAAIGGANVFISDIQLTPGSSSGTVGTNYTATATIQENGAAVANKTVSFSVTSGPHAGKTGTDVTDANGKATFSYTGTRSGTDTIVARYVDSRGNTNSSNAATRVWVNQAPSVNAGPDVTGNEGAPIALNGAASDPEGDALSRSWSYAPVSGVDAGATCAFANPSALNTTITCTDDGTYSATLTVSDGINPAVSNAAAVVVRNVAPTASFTTSPQVDEGRAISLALSNASDPSSRDAAAGFSYAFDCGSGYGAASSTASVTCATNDNGTRTVKAKISDKDGGTTEYIGSVRIDNVAPIANFTATSPVNEGDPISLALSNASDPSSADTAAGFSYAFDCDDGNGYRNAGSTASATCTTNDNGVRTVKAKITDKDGGFTEYTATSTINNVAPQATFSASSHVDEGSSISLALSNPSDPSSADTAAGFTYAFDCGSSYGAASSTTTASCATNDNGTRTVKAKISDKDGGVSEYTATSTISNVAPQATFTATSPVNEGSPISLELSNASDPSSADVAAGFSYAFDCGSGYASASSVATANCATNDNGTRTVKARISDKDGGTTEYLAIVTINNVAPVAELVTTSPVNEGSPFTISLKNASDPSSADTAAGFSYAFDCGNGYASASSATSASCATNDNGTRAVKAKITDKDGGVTEYTDTVTIDNVAPTATFTAATPVNEGSFFKLALSNASDPSSADTAAGFSYAFDCNDGFGYRNAGSTSNLSCPTSDNGIRVVSAKITDKDGGFTEYLTQVTINNVAPTVGTITAPVAPIAVGTPINVSAPFSDPGTADTHTAVIDWDDASTSAGTVTHGEGEAAGAGKVEATHTYTTPGIYTIKVTVTDDDSGSDSEIFEYVVVYDPNGGFVTGGGFITSPAGAYVKDPAATGRANFGFNSKYQKGATTPSGQTEFQFKAGSLNFHSSTYEWLVVAGAKAQYKGVGTINGSGNYGFMLTAIDGQINGGGGSDKFRIKIWDKSNGDAVVYDNQMGGATDADPTMVIQGGSIVIHQK